MSEPAPSFPASQSGKRHHPRYELTLPFDVTVLRGGVISHVTGRLQDLGEGGLSGIVSSALIAGENVQLTLSLPTIHEPLTLPARVKHQERLCCGFEFVNLEPTEAQTLQALGHSRLLQARVINIAEFNPSLAALPKREPTVMCSKCGYEYPEEVSFCVMCGTPRLPDTPVDFHPPRPERAIKLFHPSEWVGSIRSALAFYSGQATRSDTIVDSFVAIVFLVTLCLGLLQWLRAPASPAVANVSVQLGSSFVRLDRSLRRNADSAPRIAAHALAAADSIRAKGSSVVTAVVDPLAGNAPLMPLSSESVGQPGSASQAGRRRTRQASNAFSPNSNPLIGAPAAGGGMQAVFPEPSGDNGALQSARDVQDSVVQRIMPVYPTQARSQHVQGEVLLQALIGKDGSVADLRVVSGPDVLATSAIDAVRRWRFKPYEVNGQPVEVETNIRVNFALPQ